MSASHSYIIEYKRANQMSTWSNWWLVYIYIYISKY